MRCDQNRVSENYARWVWLVDRAAAPIHKACLSLRQRDNHLIELSVAGGAGLIVTRNVRDLRSGHIPFPSLRAVTPEDCLKEI